ncbi:MAG: hypothetical protein IPN58_21625 [Anaerolineales bacterium]|nr:hypothetical protein [Anaerolineales bacterium]
MINHRTVQLICIPFILPLLFNGLWRIGFVLTWFFFFGRKVLFSLADDRLWFVFHRDNGFGGFGPTTTAAIFSGTTLNRFALWRSFLRLDRSFRGNGFLSRNFLCGNLFRNYLLCDGFLCSALRLRCLLCGTALASLSAWVTVFMASMAFTTFFALTVDFFLEPLFSWFQFSLL